MNNVVQTWNGEVVPTTGEVELTDAQLVAVTGALDSTGLSLPLDWPNLRVYSKKVKLLYFSEDTSRES